MKIRQLTFWLGILARGFCLAFSFQTQAAAPKFLLLKGHVTIYTSATPGTPLYKAVSALQRDINNSLPDRCLIKPLAEIDAPGIIVINSASDRLIKPITGWEAHRVYTTSIKQRTHLIAQGADLRGTIYAIYYCSEKLLGVPPLWYYSSWQPQKMASIKVPLNLNYTCSSPQVKYRAWFPNDTDLFAPWRKLSASNNTMWLETALRLKLNTIEWFDDEFDYGKKYSVSPTTRLISEYGLVNTTHHHSPLNASLSGWEDYWRKTRDTVPPALSLSNARKLEDFWRYNVECVVKNKVDMLWVIGFRAAGDHPFWYTFKDAPESMQERGEVISQMMQRQREVVLDVVGNAPTQFRTIFYDELSDLLARGYIHPPADTSLIWTYVAARRDHYPNKDIQALPKSQTINLGYYFNYQFTSTGSHLAAGEGPWKMEQNFRYVASKSNKPLVFSVVNAGNIREFLLELSANAAMMWDFNTYTSDAFLKRYCTLYFGATNAPQAVALYKKYYNAYWQQKKPDLTGIDRQYIFQDLRYKRAIQDICAAFNKEYNPNPLKDNAGEQEPGRTFRIVPQDNGTTSQVDALLNGTAHSAASFLQVARNAEALSTVLSPATRPFFNDNLKAPAYYMYNLNTCLLRLCQAYKETDKKTRKSLLNQSVAALKAAETSLTATQHGNFAQWYEGDKIFGFNNLYPILTKLTTAD